jgi:exodeoxyribonuclease VII large subunit
MSPNAETTITSSAAPVLSVSALNQSVAKLLERNYPLTWISGEISNFTRAASGHWYFTLKDDAAQVRAVMFRGRAQLAGFTVRDGDKVEVRATVTLYAARGEYQLSVEAIRRAGVGNLYEAFMRLKEKLAAEGLFAPEAKRPLPAFARTIGIVTSPAAAALRDVLTTLSRRAPHVAVVLYPTPVQGDGAAAKIAQAIATASARAECDVLLVCRGGGSIEDLWSFNDELVARAIAACTIPVIAGVGHETDVTIADFVADLRAPTPTGAAEMASRAHADWLALLQGLADGLARAMERKLLDAEQSFDWTSRRLVSPAAYMVRERLKLQALAGRLTHAGRAPHAAARHTLAQTRTRLNARLPDAKPKRALLETEVRCAVSHMAARLDSQRQALASLSAQLELLNPQRTLERGYAIITDKKGRVVRSPKNLNPREIVSVRLAEGSAQVGIASVQPMLE